MLIERLLNNLSVTVEPFALCEVEGGCELAIDEHDSVTVHFVLAGAGYVRIARNVVEFGDHSLVIVPAGQRHVVAAAETTGESGATPLSTGLVRLSSLGVRGIADLITACGRLDVRFGSSQQLFGLMRDPIVIDFSDSPEMRRVFADMLAESGTDAPGSAVVLSSLMNRCMVIVFRRICGSEECPFPWLNALEDDRIAAVVDGVLQEPAAPHSVESLAKTASMSRTAFAAEFKSRLGTPPMTFVREVRLRKAASLLEETSLSVSAIASRVGFSRGHFSTAFAAMFGVPPGDFRRTGSD